MLHILVELLSLVVIVGLPAAIIVLLLVRIFGFV